MTHNRVQLHLDEIEQRLVRMDDGLEAVEELAAELAGLRKVVSELKQEIEVPVDAHIASLLESRWEPSWALRGPG
jgi:hypothetical protein